MPQTLEMATNQYQPSTKVVAEEELVQVATPDCKSIDEVVSFLTSANRRDHQDHGLQGGWGIGSGPLGGANDHGQLMSN